MNPLFRRVLQRQKFEKMFVERLTEPLHVNVIAAGVALFGSFRRKVDFDLILRPQYAFPLLRAADFATEWGYKKLTVVEFGVAAGAGLLNICALTDRITQETGVEFRVVGFDTGGGMPPPIDYRDMPEYYATGDFPMNVDRLKDVLPRNCELILGSIEDTLPAFLAGMSDQAPLGFVSLDVDYYSSARTALEIFRGRPEQYLPLFPIYLDDIGDVANNPWVGEDLAVNEFNVENALRKISPFTMLRARRIFKAAKWIDQIYAVHTLDHPIRTPGGRQVVQRTVDNEYIGVKF